MSFYNAGSGSFNANTGPGYQYNNNAAGPQYNYNYYPGPYIGLDIHRDTLEREKEDCLRSLSFSNIDARRQDIVQVHPNTGDWLFETPEFREWRNCTTLSRHNGVLWIKGHPGTGKSTLMKHIWRYCQRELKDRTIAEYFFHGRGESLEKTPLGMLRSLVCQLLDQEESTYQHFLPLFRQKRRLHREWEWREPELKEFLISEMQVHQRQPLVLLVDALDECRDSQVRDVVKFLEQLSLTSVRHKVNVSICLSSRHYPHITMTKYQELVVETMNGHVADISTYVHDNLTRSDPDIENGVLKKASGIFMWVVLVVAMLNKAYDEGKIEAMERKLLEVPEDLDQLFLTLLSKDYPDKQETILMLQWVLCAVRPLTAGELYHATLAGTGVKDSGPWDLTRLKADDIRRRIIHSSKGLIEARKDTGIVQFIHESVKDFLLRNHRLQSVDPTLESNPIGQCHDRLKICCVSYILMVDAAVVDPDPTHYPFLEYASMYFLDHAEAAEAANISQAGFLRQIQEVHGSHLAHTCMLRRYWEREMSNGPLCRKNASLLFRSAAHRYDNLVRALLRSNTYMNARWGHYGYVLQPAAANGSTKTVTLLLDLGADPNGFHGGFTALHRATWHRHRETMTVLLEYGADVNAQNKHWGTALHQALDSIDSRADIMTVSVLLKHGADVNAPGGLYGTALQAAVIFREEKIVELLLKYGADVNAQGGIYGTALQAAATATKSLVTLLLQHGANVNIQCGKYGTALQAAMVEGNKGTAILLLERGADVNAQGGKYGTALQAAASAPSLWMTDDPLDATKLLLEYGADVNARGGEYGSVLRAAISTGHKDIETLLREHGATM